MSFLQPATNNYCGFQPYATPGGFIQVNPYQVSSSEGSAIRIGDVVCQTSLGTVRVITGAGFVPTSSMAVVGVAASFLAANGGSTAATIITNPNQMLQVYDGPNQMFTACDTTSGVVGPLTGIFKNYAILATGCVGSSFLPSGTLNSIQAISGVTATAAGTFKILGMHPCENGIWSSGSAGGTVTSSGVRKWYGVFEAAVTLQSTQLTAMQNTTS